VKERKNGIRENRIGTVPTKKRGRGKREVVGLDSVRYACAGQEFCAPSCTMDGYESMDDIDVYM